MGNGGFMGQLLLQRFYISHLNTLTKLLANWQGWLFGYLHSRELKMLLQENKTKKCCWGLATLTVFVFFNLLWYLSWLSDRCHYNKKRTISWRHYRKIVTLFIIYLGEALKNKTKGEWETFWLFTHNISLGWVPLTVQDF